jgi:hypothetical protein
METPHKTFSPFLLVGIAVGILLIVLAMRGSMHDGRLTSDPFFASTTDEQPVPLPVEEPMVTHEAYEAAVVAIIAQYQLTSDASTAQQALLAMRVPSEDRYTHESLVILLGKAEAGDAGAAVSLYADLKKEVTWLP